MSQRPSSEPSVSGPLIAARMRNVIAIAASCEPIASSDETTSDHLYGPQEAEQAAERRAMARNLGHLRNLVARPSCQTRAVPPETRYAKSGDVSIAYQVVGEGEHDLVLVPGYISNVEFAWEWESWAHLVRSSCRSRTADHLRQARHWAIRPRDRDRAARDAHGRRARRHGRGRLRARGADRRLGGSGHDPPLRGHIPGKDNCGRAVRIVGAEGDMGSGLSRCAASRGVAAQPFPSERRRSARAQKPSGRSRGSLRASPTTRSSSIGSRASSARARAPRP